MVRKIGLIVAIPLFAGIAQGDPVTHCHYGDTTATRVESSVEAVANSDGEVYFRDKRDIDAYIFKIDNGGVYFKGPGYQTQADMWDNEMPAWMIKELLKSNL